MKIDFFDYDKTDKSMYQLKLFIVNKAGLGEKYHSSIVVCGVWYRQHLSTISSTKNLKVIDHYLIAGGYLRNFGIKYPDNTMRLYALFEIEKCFDSMFYVFDTFDTLDIFGILKVKWIFPPGSDFHGNSVRLI